MRKGFLPILPAEEQLKQARLPLNLPLNLPAITQEPMKEFLLFPATTGALLLASPLAGGATLEAYLPLNGDLSAGTGTVIAGTAIGTNGTPGDNFTTGKFGQGAFFANTNANTTTPTDWAISLGNLDTLYASSFSFSLWVQTTTAGYTADKALIGNKNWNSGANVGWTLSTINTGGAGRVNWNTSGGTRKDPAIAFNTGTWNLVTVVFDRENNEVDRFLNGVSLGKTTAALGGTGELVFVFRRADEAAGLNPVAEYDTDLAGVWTPARGGVNGVTINETENGFGTGIDRVEVRIPSSQAAAGRLFARLAVSE